MTTPRDPDLDAVLSHLRELIVRAGELSLREYEVLDQERIEFKQEKDLVTRADRNVEAFLVQELNRAYPDHDVFGEESGRTLRGSPYCWVIDPIDGTTSFVHGQPFYSVSVALQYRGRTVVGAVYAPRLGELFWAVTGRGAFLNERRLHVSSRDRLVESVVATGFACLRADLETNNLPFFNRIAPRVRGIRRYGSAAVDLCYVAAGMLEAYWEMELKLYDVAAGMLVLTEAGGRVTDFLGGTRIPESGVLATNGRVHEQMMELLSQ